MRALLPQPTDEVDLDEAYAWPETTMGRPFVRINMIESLDGAIAVSGRSGLLGGSGDSEATSASETAPDQASIDADEKALELELLRGENARLDDLRRRQLRYAEYAWTPPAQGGERRAEDQDTAGD